MKYLIVYVACMILTSWMSVSDAVRESVSRRFEFRSHHALRSIHIRNINLQILFVTNRDGLHIIMKLVKFNRNLRTFVSRERPLT